MDQLRDLIEGCARGEDTCRKQVYEHYYGYALKIVFRYVFHYETARDIVNDGFVKLFRHIGRFSATGSAHIEQQFMGWLKKIMINASIDALRKQSHSPRAEAFPARVWEQEDRSQPSDRHLLYKELILLVMKLPPAYRAVFNMVVIDGLTHQEAADLLGISVGTSKSNLSRARTLLQKEIKKMNSVSLCQT